MSKAVYVTTLPQCDICGDGTLAKYDASIPAARGSWANVCEAHFVKYGCQLGTGAGQELLLHAAGSTAPADDRETAECPIHGMQPVTRYGSTNGPDPYSIQYLACGDGVICFGPGDPNVIVT